MGPPVIRWFINPINTIVLQVSWTRKTWRSEKPTLAIYVVAPHQKKNGTINNISKNSPFSSLQTAIVYCFGYPMIYRARSLDRGSLRARCQGLLDQRQLRGGRGTLGTRGTWGTWGHPGHLAPPKDLGDVSDIVHPIWVKYVWKSSSLHGFFRNEPRKIWVLQHVFRQQEWAGEQRLGVWC